MVEDTKPLAVIEKCCSRCSEKKESDKFIKNRNICKECNNKRRQEKYHSFNETGKNADENVEVKKKCTTCNEDKTISSFIKNKIICKDCNNKKRREHYKNNEEARLKKIQKASIFKHNKVVEKQKKKLEEIGEGNKKCKYCNLIKTEDNFRHNRLRCKDCEKNHGREYRHSDIGKENSKKWVNENRERMTELQSNWFQNNKNIINGKLNERRKNDPIYKFIINQRTRIRTALENKQKKTIEYLGCNSEQFFHWISYKLKENFTYENHGRVWHIDHVIPIANFNLHDEDEQLIAFNWRNTMPLSVKENLSKNKKIIKEQIEQHLKQLINYHQEKNIDMPQKFIDLFAKHLVAGNP